MIETKIKLESKKITAKNVHAIILLVENSNFKSDIKPYYENICGRAMHTYLENLCFDFTRNVAVLNEGENPIDIAKNFLTASEITLILFSDTPLISRQRLEDYLYKFLLSNENYISMPRGYIFKTDYLKNLNSFIFPRMEQGLFDRNEFFVVSSPVDLENVSRMMQNKILNFHLNGGVKIIDKQTTKIDADVDIESGACIMPFSQLLGKTKVESGAKINFSIIKNCIICENSKIENCNLENCKVLKNANVKPFTYAKGKSIKGMK